MLTRRTIPPLQIWHAMHLAVLNSRPEEDSTSNEGAIVDVG